MGNETLKQWHLSAVDMNGVGIDTAELKDQDREHKRHMLVKELVKECICEWEETERASSSVI